MEVRLYLRLDDQMVPTEYRRVLLGWIGGDNLATLYSALSYQNSFVFIQDYKRSLDQGSVLL